MNKGFKINKRVKRIGLKIILCLVLLIFLPYLFLFFLVCGLIDFLRNKPLNLNLFEKYFFGHGDVTWVLSPFNLLIDLLTLKWRKIYNKTDFPEHVQAEIDQVLDPKNAQKIMDYLALKMKDSERGMIFYKWYGKNLETDLEIPDFHLNYKYIKTIGISVFNKNCSTSRHFGPLRLTVRLLFNLKPTENRGAYIEVSGDNHYWADNPMFIFDDTRVHQSHNQTDDLRYCMFIDILRPSIFGDLFHELFEGFLKIVQVSLLKCNNLFYKKWKFLK